MPSRVGDSEDVICVLQDSEALGRSKEGGERTGFREDESSTT